MLKIAATLLAVYFLINFSNSLKNNFVDSESHYIFAVQTQTKWNKLNQ